MTTALRSPAGLHRTDGPPSTVTSAAALLVLALAAGVVEALTHAVGAGPTDVATAVWTFLPRLVVYGLVGGVVGQLLRRRRWALWVLIVGIGGLGSASLLVEPMIWIASGPDVGATLRGWGGLEWLIAGARMVHLAAVLGAVVLLLRPTTWRFVRRVRKRPVAPEHVDDSGRPRLESNQRHLL